MARRNSSGRLQRRRSSPSAGKKPHDSNDFMCSVLCGASSVLLLLLLVICNLFQTVPSSARIRILDYQATRAGIRSSRFSFYKIVDSASNITVAYIFGTVHMNHGEMWPLVSDNAKEAFRDAAEVYFEFQLSPIPTDLIGCKYLPEKKRWLHEIFPSEFYARLETYMRGKDVEDWRHMQPFFLIFNLVPSSGMLSSSSSSSSILDHGMLFEARSAGQVVGSLETEKEKCRLYVNVSVKRAMWALDLIMRGETNTKFSEWFVERMLAERDRAMARRGLDVIRRRRKQQEQNGAVFFAVGFNHVPGMLRYFQEPANGLRVEKLTGSTDPSD